MDLKDGYWMIWRLDEDRNPFLYFEEKYGRSPTKIMLGEGVDIDIPDEVKVVKGAKVAEKHIMLQ